MARRIPTARRSAEAADFRRGTVRILGGSLDGFLHFFTTKKIQSLDRV